VNCHQTVAALSSRSAATVALSRRTDVAGDLAGAGFGRALFGIFLLADGYPIKMIKRTYLR
jgi:hypothetical protein